MNLSIKKDYQADSNQILLTGVDKFEQLELSLKEQAYIQTQLNKDVKIIEINKYNHFVYIINTNLIGKNDKRDFFRTSGNEIVSRLNKEKENSVVIRDYLNENDALLALLEGMILGNYKFSKYFKEKEKQINSLESIIVDSISVNETEINELKIVMKAVYIARDMGNEPYSALNSVQLSEHIIRLGKEAGFHVRIMNKEEIEDEGMGGLLAVNKGSGIPATFSILEWKPKNAFNIKPIVLVGKGLVYDSGGYSLKPTKNSMDMMKLDMAGAAAVLGVFYAIAINKLPVRVIGLIPSTDNLVDSKSYVPGDIIKMHNGLYVEIMNTDAEGRLILGDALSFAQKYDPELVIDIATLTGSAAIAVGSEASVLMGTADDRLFEMMRISGDFVYERTVRFPFWDEYRESLKSSLADLKNIGGSEAGAITAGKFLEYFINYPWIHIDIAGPGMLEKSKSYISSGGTGYGVRLLYRFIQSYKSANECSM